MPQRMQTTAFFLFFAAIAMSLSGQRVFAQQTDGGNKSSDVQIRALLDQQTEAWNRGDIEAFMAGYWKSGERNLLARTVFHAAGRRCWSATVRIIRIERRWAGSHFQTWKFISSARMRLTQSGNSSLSERTIGPQDSLR